MPQNVIAAFACILSVDLMVSFFVFCFLIFFVCSVMFFFRSSIFCLFNSQFCSLYIYILSWTFRSIIVQWIELVVSVQPLVSSHFSAIETRDTQTNKLCTLQSTFTSSTLYEMQCSISFSLFHTFIRNWLQSDLLFTLYARTTTPITTLWLWIKKKSDFIFTICVIRDDTIAFRLLKISY